jgi:DNA replication protein DnaC
MEKQISALLPDLAELKTILEQKSSETRQNSHETRCVRCSSADRLNDYSWCADCADKRKDGVATIPPFYRDNRLKTLDNFDPMKPFITILGETGKCKSLTAADILLRVSLQEGLIPFWQNCAELMMQIRATFKDRSAEDEADVVRRIAQKEMLVIDDLAAEKISDYSVSTLYIIINQRGEYGRKTIFTANFNTMNELKEQLGARIADRLNRYGKTIVLK